MPPGSCHGSRACPNQIQTKIHLGGFLTAVLESVVLHCAHARCEDRTENGGPAAGRHHLGSAGSECEGGPAQGLELIAVR